MRIMTAPRRASRPGRRRLGLRDESIRDCGEEIISLNPVEPFMFGDGGYFDRAADGLRAGYGESNKADGRFDQETRQVDGFLYGGGGHNQSLVQFADQSGAAFHGLFFG